MTAEVTLLPSSIGKAWRQFGGADCWLQLRTKSGLLTDFNSAVTAANRRAEQRGEAGAVWGLFPTTTIGGFLIQLVRADTLPLAVRWAEELADELSRRGFQGKLGGAPTTTPAPCLRSARPPVPTAYVNWSLAGTPAESEWGVAPDATAAIADLLETWSRRPRAQLVLQQNIHWLNVDLPDVRQQLIESVTRSGMAGVDFVEDPDTTATHASLAFGGEGVFQTVSQEDWAVRVERLLSALTALPTAMTLGYLRTARPGQLSHNALNAVVPLPNELEEHFIRYNKHLLDRYLPDAHGIQLVQTAHLENARDLSAWLITDLGQGRHLVQAPDLQAWYGETLPRSEVLAQARADFAGALLTKQIIKDNPPLS